MTATLPLPEAPTRMTIKPSLGFQQKAYIQSQSVALSLGAAVERRTIMDEENSTLGKDEYLKHSLRERSRM